MLDLLLSILAPHDCLSCGMTGTLLCTGCTADLADARVPLCLLCAGECGESGLCTACHDGLPVERALLFGERGGVLETLVNEFKFGRKQSAYWHIAGLMAELLPYRLPDDAVVVPLPTICSHIRERGYDHTLLIAREIARLKRVTVRPLLYRRGHGVQHGASREERILQADQAFAVKAPLDPERLYLLVDDIVTTGSSLRAASRVLSDAGARHIWAVALARQPLDEQG